MISGDQERQLQEQLGQKDNDGRHDGTIKSHTAQLSSEGKILGVQIRQLDRK